jgi:hypothetical protein
MWDAQADSGRGSKQGNTRNAEPLCWCGFVDFRCNPEPPLFEPRPFLLPATFSLLLRVTGGYAAGWAVCAVPAELVGIDLLRFRRKGRTDVKT